MNNKIIFTNDFLSGLYDELNKYCNNNSFEIKEWLEMQ